MILSFGDKDTESIWNGIRVKNMPLEIQNVGRRKLRMLNNAHSINDLRQPPANHLEALKGNKKGKHSIRINDQWRILFRFVNSHASEVTITDYH
ncbi:MAG TPA: type II toxin-antitoxin system RelE/ParE family toxin [Prolixibacteraceae bacterium]|nr:type II toxin-antitoxin system RelE/ParE family toxin [Prolixibacteraceae bacterium]